MGIIPVQLSRWGWYRSPPHHQTSLGTIPGPGGPPHTEHPLTGRTLQPDPCLPRSANHSMPLSLIPALNPVLRSLPSWCLFIRSVVPDVPMLIVHKPRLSHSTCPFDIRVKYNCHFIGFTQYDCASMPARTACPTARGVAVVTLTVGPYSSTLPGGSVIACGGVVRNDLLFVFFWPIPSGGCTTNRTAGVQSAGSGGL